MRVGMTGQVHNAFFTFGDDGKPKFSFKGKELLKGETDGSSYPSGGMRRTPPVVTPSSTLRLRSSSVATRSTSLRSSSPFTVRRLTRRRPSTVR